MTIKNNCLYVVDRQTRLACPLPLKINTYHGCNHECVYCFARLIDARWRSKRKNQTGNPKSTELSRLNWAFSERARNMESKLIKMRIPIMIGMNSDPCQSLELKSGNTLKVLKILDEFDYPSIIVTKAPNVLAQPKYIDILGNSMVQATITTLDESLSRRIEPFAPTPTRRLGGLRTLSDAGIITQHRLWPIIPTINEYPVDLLQACAEAGCSDVIANFLKYFNNDYFSRQMNKAIGYSIKSSCNDMVLYHNYLAPSDRYQRRVMKQLKATVVELGMGFWTPADSLHNLNNWHDCCGAQSHGYNVAEWAAMINGKRINYHTTFDEYMEGHNCPYREDYKDYWDRGQLAHYYQEFVFHKQDKTYSHESAHE